MTAFEEALMWHERGCHTSPNAMSVKHTNAILKELSDAYTILYDVASRSDTLRLEDAALSRRVNEFVVRHHGAPY